MPMKEAAARRSLEHMNVLVVGGTGVIGAGIVKHLLSRGARVATYDRGIRARDTSSGVEHIVGDRADVLAFERQFERSRYDVVIDMLCFTKADAQSTERAFGGRCHHLVLCSTVCTYGAKTPGTVFVDEHFPQEPVSTYGRNKVECERLLEGASQRGRFELTILRPTHTYGPGAPLIDQLEADGSAWDRILRGRPILCAGDGLGLWQPTHRDDCAKLFAYAAANPRTYGEAYNATGDQVLTWRDYYGEAAAALETRARLVLAPAGWLLNELPHRFGLLRDVTRHHGAYDSAKAKAAVPEFRAVVGFAAGARETFADVRRRRAWRDSSLDDEYERLVQRAIELGFEIVTV
jgi:nucleoside-diphosphate-sugar epimerase